MTDTSSIAADPMAELDTLSVTSIGGGESLRVARTPRLDDARLSLKTRRSVLMVCDLLLLSVSVIVVALSHSPSIGAFWALWLFPVITLGALGMRGVYRTRLRLSALEDASRIAMSTAVAAMAALTIHALAAGTTERAAGSLALRVWLLASALVAGAHLLIARMGRTDAALHPGARVLIVGGGSVASRVERRLREAEHDISIVGFLDVDFDCPDVARTDDPNVLGSPTELQRVARETHPDHVVFAFGAVPDSVLAPLVRECHALDIRVSVVPRLYEAMSSGITVEHLGGLPLVGLRYINPKGWQFVVKHAIDRIAAAAIVLLMLPMMAALAAAVRLSSPGPIFYRQRRVGRDGRDFVMLKFRSMRVTPQPSTLSPEALDREDLAPGGVEGEDRRTAVGTFLRKSSLDELPQLLNVLKGEMSLVGPRPERPEFVARFGTSVPRYRDRHRVRSGITGWAQVCNLRGQTSLRDRVEWDNYYIENWSLLLDLKILLLTIPAMLRSVE